jgi:hypothetical protein
MPLPRTQRAGALLSTLALAAVFAASPASARDAKPIALPAGAAAIEAAIELPDAAHFKGVKRVVVPEFSIEFLTDNGASSSASTTGGTNRVHQRWKLAGVGATEFQAITNEAYAGLLKALTAAGYEVVSAEAMRAHPAYAKLQAKGQATGVATNGGLAMAPAGMAVMPMGTVSSRSAGGPLATLAALQTMGAMASAVSATFELNELAQGLDATVLAVRVGTDFSEVGATNTGFIGRMSGNAGVAGKAQPSLKPQSTAIRLITPAVKGAQMTLTAPLLLPADTFSGARDATSTAAIAGDIAGALIRFSAGAGGSSMTKEYEVTAEPAQYTQRMTEGIDQLMQAMAAKLAAAR